MNQVDRLEARVAALQMRLAQLEGAPRFARRSKSEAAEEARAFSDDEVLAAVCGQVGISVAEVKGPSRTREISRKRAIVATILAVRINWGVRQIARTLEKDHKAIKRMIA